MARFSKVEIDTSPAHPDAIKPQPGDGERDERYWFALAEENRRQGHFENALRFYSRALEIEKSLVPAWLGQARMLIALDESKEAELWARKALELFKNNAELMAARAQALFRMGDRSQALSLCDAALKQEGQSAFRWMVRGELFLDKRQDIDRHCFDKAMLIDCDWLVPAEIAANCMFHGYATKAATYHKKAIELAPDNAYAWFMKARCEIELDLAGAAKKSLARVLELAPNHVEAAHALGELENRGWSLKRALRKLLPRR